MKKRILACLLALVMLIGVLPVMALADGGAATYYVNAFKGSDTNNGSQQSPFRTVEKAAQSASSGDTICLGEGNYTLYGISSVNTTKGKNLTFVGQGADKTSWNIGAEVLNPAYFGTEYNGDYRSCVPARPIILALSAQTILLSKIVPSKVRPSTGATPPQHSRTPHSTVPPVITRFGLTVRPR